MALHPGNATKHRTLSATCSGWSFLVVTVAGCALPAVLTGETEGDRVRKVLAHIDATCRANKKGPYLDPRDPEYLQKRRYTDCDILKVKRFDLNEVLAMPEGQFAYSIKLPAPLDKPRVNRRHYYNARSYFEALCEKEAGEYIFKSVSGVNGIAVLRTPGRPWQYSLGFLSDESGAFSGGAYPERSFITSSPRFDFLERPVREDERRQFPTAAFLRFSMEPGREVKLPDYGLRSEPISHRSARYGYVWRTTEHLNDRENGVLGGDVLVMNFQTNELLAVRAALVFTK